MGDFNLDLLKNSDPDVDHFEEILLSYGYFPLISLDTHKIPGKVGSCIDNIFTNDVEAVTQSGIIHDTGTHHSQIFTMLNLNLNKQENNSPKQFQHYSFSKENVSRLVEDLETRSPNLIGPDQNCPNFDFFFGEFCGAVDKHCKLEKPRCTKRNSVNNPWITDGIIEAIEHKKKLYTMWKRSCNSKKPEGEKTYTKVSVTTAGA